MLAVSARWAFLAAHVDGGQVMLKHVTDAVAQLHTKGTSDRLVAGWHCATLNAHIAHAACRYNPYHIYILVIVTLVVFAFMAGEYPFWLQHTTRPVERPSSSPSVGPGAMARWAVSFRPEWRAFSPYFLVRRCCQDKLSCKRLDLRVI